MCNGYTASLQLKSADFEKWSHGRMSPFKGCSKGWERVQLTIAECPLFDDNMSQQCMCQSVFVNIAALGPGQ